jgi:predicted O-methyltransferase YrrM
LRRSSVRAPEHIKYPPLANNDVEKRILATISEAVRKNEIFRGVPVTDGRMLRLLVESTGATRVLEIGTSTGISALWLLLGLSATGGHLTTLEIDAQRAALARAHFRQAGVDSLVTLVEGDARRSIADLQGPLDIVFVDCGVGGDAAILERTLTLLRPGGLFVVHHVVRALDLVEIITANPAHDTVFYMQGRGLSVTLKKH